MSNTENQPSQWEAQTATNTKRLALWTVGWLISLALATFGPMFLWDSGAFPSAIAIVVNLILGAGMIWANKCHLQGLDELQRQVQLEAMALSLGVGLITGLAFSTMDVVNLIGFDAEISYMVILMSLTYAAGIVIGRRKYQ